METPCSQNLYSNQFKSKDKQAHLVSSTIARGGFAATPCMVSVRQDATHLLSGGLLRPLRLCALSQRSPALCFALLLLLSERAGLSCSLLFSLLRSIRMGST